MGNCSICFGELIWQNDFSFEDYGLDDEGLVRICLCSECGAIIETYAGDEE